MKYLHLYPCNHNCIAHTRVTQLFKCLIGIVASGAVAFISELFFGSISDCELFEQSGLLKLLKSVPHGKSLMADRRFDVEDLLAPLGLKLNVPTRKQGCS